MLFKTVLAAAVAVTSVSALAIERAEITVSSRLGKH